MSHFEMCMNAAHVNPDKSDRVKCSVNCVDVN